MKHPFPLFSVLRSSITPLLLSGALFAPEMLAAEFRFAPVEQEGTVTLSPSLKENPTARIAAQRFIDTLTRMTGKEWKMGDGVETGVVLAITQDFPELAATAGLKGNDPFQREAYYLKSSGERLLLLAATPLGLQHGVEDLLHRLGYRHYFPGETWEVVPHLEKAALDIDETQRPAYVFRDLFTTAFRPGEEPMFNQWRQTNRLGSGFQLNTRHAYLAIFRRHEKTFADHPEYFAKVDGVRRDPRKDRDFKFNAANPDLIKLLVDDAKAILSAPDAEDSISMDPSDFGGWDNSGEAFEKVGTPSNQAVTMANAVAREAAAPLGKYVGMYAYYDHQFPPDIPVEPNIIVSFATRFLKPDGDVFENITAWRAKGVQQVGIRDYCSFWPWDQAMPGRALGGNLHYLNRALKRYFEIGARFYTAESQGGWGAYGLGYYSLTRWLWNPEEPQEVIVNDFLAHAFGPAAETIRRYFELVNGDGMVAARFRSPGELYAPILESLPLAKNDPSVTRRLEALLVYVRYTELLSALERAPLNERQTALKALYDWTLRATPTQMIPTEAIALRRKSGLRVVYPTLEHPSAGQLQKMLADAEARPIEREELLGYAQNAVARWKAERDEERKADAAPEVTGPTRSPWIRYSAAFAFPMKAGEEASATLSMRRFGFSGFPRYLVTGPDGSTVQRGEMQSDEQTVKFTSSAAGVYTLYFEPTPNLIRCESERGFYLLPVRDFGTLDLVSFRGALHILLPGDRPVLLSAGGQSEHERVAVGYLSPDGKVLASDKAVNGIEPLAYRSEPTGTPLPLRVRFGKPSSGNFEDMHLRLHGDFYAPIFLSPIPLIAPHHE